MVLDVQPVPTQPSVFSPTVSVSMAASAGLNALTRPSGTALHVLRDAEYIVYTRSLVGTCTRDEWDRPAYRRLAIARAWERAVSAIRAENETFVAFAPVTLYCDPQTGAVHFADISLPGATTPKLVTANGTRVVSAPANLAAAFTIQRTTYARWAEGPLPHVSLDTQRGPTPDDDRDIQYLRHQNASLRALIDGALGPAEWADVPHDSRVDDGLVDFRIRGAFGRQELRRFDSKQTGDVSALVIDGAAVSATDFDATSEDALDAILEAD